MKRHLAILIALLGLLNVSKAAESYIIWPWLTNQLPTAGFTATVYAQDYRIGQAFIAHPVNKPSKFVLPIIVENVNVALPVMHQIGMQPPGYYLSTNTLYFHRGATSWSDPWWEYVFHDVIAEMTYLSWSANGHSYDCFYGGYQEIDLPKGPSHPTFTVYGSRYSETVNFKSYSSMVRRQQNCTEYGDAGIRWTSVGRCYNNLIPNPPAVFDATGFGQTNQVDEVESTGLPTTVNVTMPHMSVVYDLTGTVLALNLDALPGAPAGGTFLDAHPDNTALIKSTSTEVFLDFGDPSPPSSDNWISFYDFTTGQRQAVWYGLHADDLNAPPAVHTARNSLNDWLDANGYTLTVNSDAVGQVTTYLVEEEPNPPTPDNVNVFTTEYIYQVASKLGTVFQTKPIYLKP
jgi:hypothetical protein